MIIRNCPSCYDYNVFGVDSEACCYRYHKYCKDVENCVMKTLYIGCENDDLKYIFNCEE